jgi:hypothetical protein
MPSRKQRTDSKSVDDGSQDPAIDLLSPVGLGAAAGVAHPIAGARPAFGCD